MKYLLKISIVSLFVFAILVDVYSQLSEGGTPPGFKLAHDEHLTVEQMPGFNLDSVFDTDLLTVHGKDHPYQFGYNYLVNYDIHNSGRIVKLNNGDRIWQLDVKSPGAFSINLAFSNFHLPEGAKMFIYSKDHSQILGAFTAKNNFHDNFFGTGFIYDDEVVIEYFEPAAVFNQGTFTLFRVTHAFKNVLGALRSFGDASACLNNINCPPYAAWSEQKRSVVCLVSGGNEFCSGALVNNTLNDGTPYILTANHCGTADGTWIFLFNWEAPACPNPASNPASQSISGATPVSNRAGSDFDLCLMSAVPPSNFNAFYAGWDHSGTPATSVTCIHHPNGDIKKISQANNSVSAAVYTGVQTWHVAQWTDGVTEPGSSGSPLFDQNKRIIGQLNGGSSYCGAPANELNDDYGRFDISWNTGNAASTRLRDWLDPNNSGALTNDGYDPNIGLYVLDAAAASVIFPSGSFCNTVFTPTVMIRNLGSSLLSALDILFHLDSNAGDTLHWTGSLTTGNATTVNLPSLTAAPGNHTFYVSVSNPDGGTDQNAINNSTSGVFTILNPNPVSLPFTEDFSQSAFPPNGWSIGNPNTNNTWIRTSTIGGFGNSNGSAMEDETLPVLSTEGEVDDLITPYINMDTGSSPAFLKFDVAYAKYDNTYFDSLTVLASSDCGLNWTRIYAKGGNSLATALNTQNPFVPTSTQWRRDSVDISGFLGQAVVKFAFEHISGWGNITYIDNINVAAYGQTSDVGTKPVTDPGAKNPNGGSLFSLKILPNPFDAHFSFQFELQEHGKVTARLFSADGKLIKQLIDDENLSAGFHRFEITAPELSSGLYFLHINERFLKIQKM